MYLALCGNEAMLPFACYSGTFDGSWVQEMVVVLQTSNLQQHMEKKINLCIQDLLVHICSYIMTGTGINYALILDVFH